MIHCLPREFNSDFAGEPILSSNMQSQTSSFHPESLDIKSTYSRRPVPIKKPTKVVSWRADLGGPNFEFQPVDGHGNAWAGSSRARLPWLRNSKKTNNPSALSQSSSENFETATSSPQLGLDSTAAEDIEHRVVVPRNSNLSLGAHNNDHIIEIDRLRPKIISSAVRIQAPSAQRPNYAAKVLQHERPDPMEALSSSLRQYESLMDQMVAVTREAADFMIANQEYERDMFSSPSSLDSADDEEEIFYEVPFASAHGVGQQLPKEASGHEGSSGDHHLLNLEGIHVVDIPERYQSRDAMLSVQMSPMTRYPNGRGLSESYYHPSQMPTAPSDTRDVEAKKHLQRRKPRAGDDGVHRATSAPKPWRKDADRETDPEHGLQTSQSVPKDLRKGVAEREVFNPSPLPYVTTQSGNVHLNRRQPIARK